MDDSLILKWGTIKGWNNLSEKSAAIVKKWAALGSSISSTNDTPEQKLLVCELIDSLSKHALIWHEWDGRKMTKKDAKQYVMEYGK